MIITDAITNPSFSRHESFHLRYGWLKKAYDQVMDDDQVFHRSDVTVRLGVGKNMVNAIRFWSVANKILKHADTKKKHIVPTEIGHMIFADKGLDPYLENTDTLWLLHWLLFAPPCVVPSWWMIMNEFSASNIQIKEMTEAIITRVTNIAEWKTPSPKSIKKDIDVFLHTYTTRRDKLSMEDYLNCPFRQLFLLHQNSQDEMRFVSGRKHNLSPLITAYACIDFIDRTNTTTKMVSVGRLATEFGGIGNIFKLNENELVELLTDACLLSDSIHMQNINGAPHLKFDSTSKDKILCKIYNKTHLPKTKQIKIEVLA